MIDRSNSKPMFKQAKRKSKLVRTRINPISKKKVKANAIYSRLRRAFLKKHPVCQHWLAENGWYELTYDSCQRYAKVDDKVTFPADVMFLKFKAPASGEIHHKRGRGRFFLDVGTWMAVRPGHEIYIHNDPKRYEKGYCLSR